MNRTNGNPSRARLLLVAVALSLAGLLTPIAGPATPAGAWGNTGAGGAHCGATGASNKTPTRSWGTTYGSTCGSNRVRFRSWGFYSDWVTSPSGGTAANIVDQSALWGGADHAACVGCTVVPTGPPALDRGWRLRRDPAETICPRSGSHHRARPRRPRRLRWG